MWKKETTLIRVFGRGEMAGQVDLAFPEDGASQYGINLVLRGADVRQLTGEVGQDVRGQLNASLALAGD